MGSSVLGLSGLFSLYKQYFLDVSVVCLAKFSFLVGRQILKSKYHNRQICVESHFYLRLL